MGSLHAWMNHPYIHNRRRNLNKFNRDRLTELSEVAAESLSKHQGTLDLIGLTKLSDAVAESLSKHQGDLDLRGLRKLSDAAAESFSKHKGEIEHC